MDRAAEKEDVRAVFLTRYREVGLRELKRDCKVFTLDKRDFRIYRRLERQVIPLVAPC
jgi:hypothetical protein